ncbi:MAG: ABC transporter permease subunit [Geminicoccaceae bacterium]|nr:MAG: ABC transporter permease subunit [Geminicoccaceae bacterium]
MAPLFTRAGTTALGIALLVGVWQAIHLIWGPFVLPSPAATLRSLQAFLAEPAMAQSLARTTWAAVLGFVGGAAVGIVLGAIAGRSRLIFELLNPSIVAILAVPPIAWVILALLWFGATGTGAALTAALALMPLVFAATVQGMRTIDPTLEAMATAFGAGPGLRLLHVRLPQVTAYVIPALATAHGIAWKAVVMAEVLGAGQGLGADLATARAHLDLPRALALVVLVAAIVLLIDGLVLDPLRRRVEAWRNPDRGMAAC